MDRLDTADLSPIDPCYTTARKKVPGFFSDELKGHTMTEFCALRAKSYAYNIYAGEDDAVRDKDDKFKVGGERSSRFLLIRLPVPYVLKYYPDDVDSNKN
jgi:hypothetical protein